MVALAYTYAQANRGRSVFMLVVKIPMLWLPWAIMLVTLVVQGYGMALNQCFGLLAAHLYEVLTRIWPTYGGGRDMVSGLTPNLFHRLLPPQSSESARKYGVAKPSTDGQFSGFSSVLPESWRSRGRGQRLGG